MLKWLLLSIPLLALGAYFTGHAVLGPRLAPGNVMPPTATSSPDAAVAADTSMTAPPAGFTLVTGQWSGADDQAAGLAIDAIARVHGADNRLTLLAHIGSGMHPLIVTHRQALGDFYRHAHLGIKAHGR